MILCISTSRPVEASVLCYEASVKVTQSDAALLETLSAWFGDNKAELLRVALAKGMEELNAMMQQGLAADKEAKE